MKFSFTSAVRVLPQKYSNQACACARGSSFTIRAHTTHRGDHWTHALRASAPDRVEYVLVEVLNRRLRHEDVRTAQRGDATRCQAGSTVAHDSVQHRLLLLTQHTHVVATRTYVHHCAKSLYFLFSLLLIAPYSLVSDAFNCLQVTIVKLYCIQNSRYGSRMSTYTAETLEAGVTTVGRRLQ